jgi:predicted component of type VI protein secretion system
VPQTTPQSKGTRDAQPAMTLVLQGIKLNDEPMSQPLIGRFDERGGTVGRSDNATFTLPDPERLISRVQAQILFRDEGYWIENVSRANSTLHNGRPLSAGMRILLREGDELRIGGYTLVAAFESGETSATILRGRTVIMPPKGPPTRPGAAPVPLEIPSSPAEVSQSFQAPAVSPRLPRAVPLEVSLDQPSSSPSVTPQTNSCDQSLWHGFQEGAGIELPLPNGLSPEFLRGVGALLRVAIEGIHRLVTMRATAKDEMHTDRTQIQIQTHGNNPLKLAPDAIVALEQLLLPPAGGYLPGATALRETMIDLQSHQIGTTAGMRSALEAVLDRFDPPKVEALLTTGSVFESLMPTHRRARLWELYLEHYRSVREDAQEDFQRLFGEAFRQAYEAQVRSLNAANETAAFGPKAAGGGR